jgi:hypothetical protein
VVVVVAAAAATGTVLARSLFVCGLL